MPRSLLRFPVFLASITLAVACTATRFAITITEGRNRQVRRMVRAVGAKVERLHRSRIGPLELGELALGAWRHLTAREVAALRSAAARSAQQ